MNTSLISEWLPALPTSQHPLAGPSPGLWGMIALAAILMARLISWPKRRRTAAGLPTKMLRFLGWTVPVLAALVVGYWQGVDRAASISSLYPGENVTVVGRLTRVVAAPAAAATTPSTKSTAMFITTAAPSPSPTRPATSNGNTTAVARLQDPTGLLLLQFSETSPAPGNLVLAQGTIRQTPSGGRFVEVRSYFALPGS